MVKPKGLGRGLDALLSGDTETTSESDTLRTLPVGQLQPGKYQPRSYLQVICWMWGVVVACQAW